MDILRMAIIAGMIVLALPAFASEKPSAWFCMQARAHRAQFPSDKAAEEAARARGADSATIAKAKQCRR